MNPRNDNIFYKKTICLKKIEKLEEALICIEKALKLNSNNIKYLFKIIRYFR